MMRSMENRAPMAIGVALDSLPPPIYTSANGETVEDADDPATKEQRRKWWCWILTPNLSKEYLDRMKERLCGFDHAFGLGYMGLIKILAAAAIVLKGVGGILFIVGSSHRAFLVVTYITRFPLYTHNC